MMRETKQAANKAQKRKLIIPSASKVGLPLRSDLRGQPVHEVFLGFPALIFEPKPLVHFSTNPVAFVDAPEGETDHG